MRLDYDLDVGALYIQIAEGDIARTETIDEETLVDVDATGAVLGIEVISPATRVWPLERILQKYAFSAEEAEQLRAYFKGSSGEPQPAPTIRVEQSKPLCAV
ncbi:DUF2283 domain-containing protein [Streptosporangium sp. NPDC002524]|uniref:DUF2283 domain-containing protein n=1 Tax=Streptosporangium sp. NPDC002524 TaxID=3154537 RepID=UPI00332E1A59